MELQKIEHILDKYLEGESSLKEEKQLREYFSSGNVAPHLQEYVALFGYFSFSEKESYQGKVKFRQEKKKVFSFVAVAASVVLLAGIFLQQGKESTEFGTYEDPEIALQKTKEALQLVSKYMNTGKEDLVYLKEFNNAKDEFLK